jgi:hypothetical protein
VDINPEAVGITKLSLFLEIAYGGKQLPDLDVIIKCGNSIVDNDSEDIDDEAKQTLKIFDWNTEFKEIIDSGGFDIIIGNPPYVRQEKIGDIKPFLDGRYCVYTSTADLYVYFYERGISLLKDGGYLGYISSNKWMKTKYGKNLRVFLKKYHLNEIIDFTELNVFKEAATEPCIIILRNEEKMNENIHAFTVDSLGFENLTKYFVNNYFIFDQSNFQDEGWTLIQSKETHSILRKIKQDSIDLTEYIGKNKLKMGIKTGKNPVFRLDREKYDEICEKDEKSKEIIKPLIECVNIKKFHYELSDKFLILTKIGVNIDDYPAIKEYLEEYKKELQKQIDDKTGNRGDNWYELRPCDYYDLFEQPKIVYIHTAKKHFFTLDTKNNYIINNGYFISSDDKYLLAYLNSKLFEFYKINTFVSFGDAKTKGRCKLDYNKMLVVPIKKIDDEEKKDFETRVDRIMTLHEELKSTRTEFIEYITDKYEWEKVPKKFETHFWDLESKEFLKVLKKSLKLTDENEDYLYTRFKKKKDEMKDKLDEINKLENEIDDAIYSIYDISKTEQEFIEKTLRMLS